MLSMRGIQQESLAWPVTWHSAVRFQRATFLIDSMQQVRLGQVESPCRLQGLNIREDCLIPNGCEEDLSSWDLLRIGHLLCAQAWRMRGRRSHRLRLSSAIRLHGQFGGRGLQARGQQALQGPAPLVPLCQIRIGLSQEQNFRGALGSYHKASK